ncbi:hypothetical protein PQX77_018160 [Marasmius sp. AFHP31]|nr:hypothetical protein PQX77_018160 [Marasmius sp. AFHP31]
MRSYTKYSLAHKAYSEAVNTRNVLPDPHTGDLIYWLAQFLYLHQLEEFQEDLRAKTSVRATSIGKTEDQQRIVKSVTILSVAVLEHRCRIVHNKEPDQVELGTPTPVTPTSASAPKQHLTDVLDELNQDSLDKRSRLDDGYGGLCAGRSQPIAPNSTASSSRKGKDRATSGLPAKDELSSVAGLTTSTPSARAVSKRKEVTKDPEIIEISDNTKSSKRTNPFISLEAELSSNEADETADIKVFASNRPGPSTRHVQSTAGPRNKRVNAVLEHLETDAISREAESHKQLRTTISPQGDNDSSMEGLESSIAEPRCVSPSNTYYWAFRKIMLGPEEVAEWTKHQILEVGLLDDVDLAENSDTELTEGEIERMKSKRASWPLTKKLEAEREWLAEKKANTPILKAEVLLVPWLKCSPDGPTAYNQARPHTLFQLSSEAQFYSKSPVVACSNKRDCCATLHECPHINAPTIPPALAALFVSSQHLHVCRCVRRMPPPDNWVLEDGDPIVVIRWTTFEDVDGNTAGISSEIDIGRDSSHTGTVIMSSPTVNYGPFCEVKLESEIEGTTGFSFFLPKFLLRKMFSISDDIWLPDGSSGLLTAVEDCSTVSVTSVDSQLRLQWLWIRLEHTDFRIQSVERFHVNTLRRVNCQADMTQFSWTAPSKSSPLNPPRSANDLQWEPTPTSSQVKPPFLHAKQDYAPATNQQDEELSFHVGDEIRILGHPEGEGRWWYGELKGRKGLVKGSAVMLVEAIGPKTPIAPWKGLEVAVVHKGEHKGEYGRVLDVNVRRETTISGLAVTVSLKTMRTSSLRSVFEIDYNCICTRE